MSNEPQGFLHFAGIVGRLEIDNGLIDKLTLGRAGQDIGRKHYGSHSESIVVERVTRLLSFWIHPGKERSALFQIFNDGIETNVSMRG